MTIVLEFGTNEEWYCVVSLFLWEKGIHAKDMRYDSCTFLCLGTVLLALQRMQMTTRGSCFCMFVDSCVLLIALWLYASFNVVS
jgi:hypothetical protein